jgi:hypothetical protein
MLGAVCELLAREFSMPSYARFHSLTVDAYTVQHPGVPDRRSIQSVAVHSMSLCLVIERWIAPADPAASAADRQAPADLEVA